MKTSRGAKEFRAKLKKVGMKPKDLANKLGRSRRQADRWATGKTPVPEYVWIILDSLKSNAA